jgi:hypothetical protein
MFQRTVATITVLLAAITGFAAVSSSTAYATEIPGHPMTPARAIAFVQAHHSATAMLAALEALSPSDRQYVVTYALTPRKLVVTGSSGSSTTAARLQTRVLASAASCGSWQHDFTAKSYSWLGLWLFTYHSQWQWSGCSGKITAAHHQERGDTAPGWSFDYSQYGAGYGCKGCGMIGRETFGHFSFIKYAIHDTADLQVQVHGNGGWWAWAKITGP